jgi:hypothetical protein
MPDRSKVKNQTRKDTLVLKVGDWECDRPHPVKKKKKPKSTEPQRCLVRDLQTEDDMAIRKSEEYEVGGDKVGDRKTGGTFRRRPGPRGYCSVIHGWNDIL